MSGINDVMDKLEDVLDKIADNKEKLSEIEAKIDVAKSVQRICYHCGGDGLKAVVGGEPISCPDCGGDGYKAYGRITLTTEE